MSRFIVFLFVVFVPMVVCAEPMVGDVVEVAPGVESTQSQMWPRAAWASDSKAWLVAWREGHANELATDIWCARISEGGKALDATGIKICTVRDNQERPGVASDGKGYLVVWEDFRNGKDYDVYAARISADGKVLDPDGFLVAGGAHNQCHPVAVFAGGNYTVVWQAFAPGAYGRYLLHSTRVSVDGKVLDPKDVMLTPAGGSKDVIDATANAVNPVVSAVGDRVFVGHLITARTKKGKGKHAAIVSVDGASGVAIGTTRALGSARGKHVGLLTNATQRMPALAFGKNGGLFATPLSKHTSAGNFLALWRLDAEGKEIGAPQKIAGIRGGRFSPLYSVAFDGNAYLLTLDRPVMMGRNRPVLKVFGLSVPAAGVPLPGGDISEVAFAKSTFVIAGDGEKDQMQGYACAGPKGTCIVVYVEVRGPDDMVVLARLISTK